MAHVTTETSPSTSSSVEPTVTVSQVDYKRLLQLQVTDSTATSSYGTSLGTSVLLASRDPSWIIDLGAFFHMLGIKILFTRLSQLSDIRSVAIVDGCFCSIDGEWVVLVFSQLILEKVLYVPNFPVNLLSINAITKQLFCCGTFFPFYCTFQDL